MAHGKLMGSVATLVMLSGCYSLRPVTQVAPEAGTRVAFDVTDSGRAALSGQIGPEVSRIEGKLISDGNNATEGYLLSVSSVKLFRGGEQVWAGERVQLKPQYVGNKYERRFSVGRTAFAGAVAVGAVGAFLVTRSLLGGGTNNPDGPPCMGEDCLPGTRIVRLP